MPAGHPPTRLLRQAGILAAWVAFGLACGSVGDPRPPLLNLPHPVEDLSARQVAHEIEVAWSWPVTTTEGMIARQIGGFTLWSVDVPGFSGELRPETIDEYRRAVVALGPDDYVDRGPGDRLTVRSPLEDWQLGQTTVLTVTTSNTAGQDAGYSNQVRLHPLDPPGATEWAAASVEVDGVALTWLPATRAEEYAIERASGDGGEFRRLGRLALTSFLDRMVRWGTKYRYRLRPMRSSDAGWIEGPLSGTVAVTPEDTFAPVAPEDLRAVRATASVELSWLPNTEEDIEGYRVHRNGEIISPLLTGPSYSDVSAPTDSALEYAVTAVDSKGNESEPGPKLTVPATDAQAN